MNNPKWTWFAVAYQTGFAYAISLCIYQFGSLFSGNFGFGTVAALIVAAAFLYFLIRPQRENESSGTASPVRV